MYDDDLDVFGWLRQGAPDGRRCLEAQVMDWADDIAYSVHDLEDAVDAGHLRLDVLRDPGERGAADRADRLPGSPAPTAAEVEEALDRLLALPFWPSAYDGSHRSLAALKNTTSQLIGRFCQAAEHATREAVRRRGRCAATTPTWWCRGRPGSRSRCSRRWPTAT